MADSIRLPKPMVDAIRMALNSISRTEINQGRYRTTYDIADELGKILEGETKQHPAERRKRK